MNKHHHPIPTPPTLVIAVGRRANEIARDVHAIFLRGAAHRRVTTAFIFLCPDKGEPGGLKLQSFDETQTSVDEETLATNPESEVAARSLKDQLEAVLHGLRLHQRLIEVGLGDERDLPLGLVMLADLSDPSAACLPPLLEALCDLLEREPNHYAYLLALTAVFEEGELSRVPLALAHLNLDTLGKNAGEADWPFHIFLFDRYKEGVWEVKDETELRLLAGNFLLALLSGRFAQRLEHLLPRSDVLDKGAFYNAASTTAILFDPVALIEDCAFRLGKQVLADFYAGGQTPPQIVEQVAVSIQARMGDLRDWAVRACVNTPFHVRSDAEPGVELHLSELSFEGLPVQEWGDAIAGYAAYFEREMAPGIADSQKGNLDTLREKVSMILEEQAGHLPQRFDLYPGGPHGAVQVTQKLGLLIQKRLQLCLPIDKEEAVRSSLESAFENAMHDMDRLVSSFPALPRWLRRLPGPLYSYGVMAFNFLFRRREHQQLVGLREACVRALERKLSLDFEQSLRRALTGLCHTLMDALTDTDQQLKNLLTTFEVAQARLDEQQGAGSMLPSPFCALLMNEELLAWADERLRRSPADLRNELLDAGILLDWRQITAEQLAAKILACCRDVYQPLHDLNIEELIHRSGEDAPLATLTALTQGAVPLLRPNFDLTGDGPSFQAQFCLCAEPHASRTMSMLKASFGEWQGIPTGDAAITLCCRTRLMLPGSALQGLFRRGEEALESLSDDRRRELADMGACQNVNEEGA
jgi:hypothetical protein